MKKTMKKKREDYEIGKTIIYFVRHGDRLETTDNSRIPGPGLSVKGHAQAKAIAKKFVKLKGQADVVYTSTMKRAQETAGYISKIVDKKVISVEEFCEFNKFLWKGKYYHPKFWKHYFRYRNAQKKFAEILSKHEGKTIIIIIHGNVIKGIIGKYVGVPFLTRGSMGYDNCSVSKIRFSGKKFDYLYYYNASHV
jgi:broad specificity phosphatase PhoE